MNATTKIIICAIFVANNIGNEFHIPVGLTKTITMNIQLECLWQNNNYDKNNHCTMLLY